MANHVINAKQRGEIIVCDPRKIETARIADMHIALKNGSNIALLAAPRACHYCKKKPVRQAFVASRTEGLKYSKIVEGYIRGVRRDHWRDAGRLN